MTSHDSKQDSWAFTLVLKLKFNQWMTELTCNFKKATDGHLKEIVMWELLIQMLAAIGYALVGGYWIKDMMQVYIYK